MKKPLLKIASILLALLLTLSLAACFPLTNVDLSKYLSYQVDNSYFEPVTYKPQTYTDISNGDTTYYYLFEITSSCSVDLYKFVAEVEIYSASSTLLDVKTINKTQDVAANEKFSFVVPVSSAIQSTASRIEVTFTGKSHTNPMLGGDKQQVNVTFICNNGGLNTVVTLNKGERVAQPQNPTKENHYFVGWYTNSYFTNKYDFSAPVTRDLMLYAKYEVDTLSIGDKIQSQALKSVVTIYNKCYNSLFGIEIVSSTSQGSGFCFEVSNGCYYLLTNCHVAYKDSKFDKQTFTIVDYLGNQYQGYLYANPSNSVAAIAASYDLACLYFKSTNTPVTQLEIADENPSIYTNVVSIGAPNGQSNTVTYGKISEYRKVTLSDTDKNLSNVTFSVICHNADIDNGSSGGPLLNVKLQVVGVNYAGMDNSTTGYAIPAAKVKEFLNKYVYTQSTKANEKSLAFFVANYSVFGSIFARNLPV